MPTMQKNELTELALTLTLGWGAISLLSAPVGAFFGGEYAIGEPTRDLYDHLFLLDQWTTVAEGGLLQMGGA